MKKSILILSSIAFAILVLSGCTSQEAVDVKSEIEAANQTLIEAVRSGDTEALGNIYLEGVNVYPPNMDIVSGLENAVQMMSGMSAMGYVMKLTTISAMAYGTTAIEDGKYELMVEGNVVDYGKYIVIWKKKGDAWMISKDIWNTSMPLPPKPEPVEEAEEVVEE